MDTSDFDYELPRELIAQAPVEPRDAARLLCLDGAGPARHLHVSDLPGVLEPGDLMVMNDTRVLPARVFARRETGGRVELLWSGMAAALGGGAEPPAGAWTAMVRPAKKLRPGEVLTCERDPDVRVEAIERVAPGSASWVLRFTQPGAVEPLLERVGVVPLPPYIEREAGAEDVASYQTIYAREAGAVAAPTAGLHFTPALFEALAARGVERTFVTLHVGAGTFLPVTAERIEDHAMHEERYLLPAAVIERIRAARAAGGSVIAIGTTSARTLESCAEVINGSGPARDVAGSTRLFLHPGNPPRVIDGLFTNFHLPKSTLIMLVSSLIGRERTLALYREAVERRYRFFSYGDAMLLLPRR